MITCEGCDEEATQADSEGVMLCEECYQVLVEETKKENDKKEFESAQ